MCKLVSENPNRRNFCRVAFDHEDRLVKGSFAFKVRKVLAPRTEEDAAEDLEGREPSPAWRE